MIDKAPDHTLTAAGIISLLELCYKTGNPDISETLFRRISNAHFMSDVKLVEGLIPLIPMLEQFRSQRHIKHSANPYFGFAIKNILSAWAIKVLEPASLNASNQLDAIRKNTCPCEPCRKLVDIMINPALPVGSRHQARTVHLSVGKKKKKHVEEQMLRYGGGTVEVLPNKRGGPLEMQVRYFSTCSST